MHLQVVATGEGHRLRCDDGTAAVVADIELVNKFLKHLVVRCFSPATVRAYAYDLLNFLRFLSGRRATLADVVPTDLFDYLDWQQQPPATAGVRVVRLADRRGAAPASVNRRVAAVRGWIIRYRRVVVRVGCARNGVACSATSARAGRAPVVGWSGSPGGCRNR